MNTERQRAKITARTRGRNDREPLQRCHNALHSGGVRRGTSPRYFRISPAWIPSLPRCRGHLISNQPTLPRARTYSLVIVNSAINSALVCSSSIVHRRRLPPACSRAISLAVAGTDAGSTIVRGARPGRGDSYTRELARVSGGSLSHACATRATGDCSSSGRRCVFGCRYRLAWSRRRIGSTAM